MPSNRSKYSEEMRENNQDIEIFMEEASSFYDSVLKDIHYESGSTRNQESNSLHPFDILAEVKSYSKKKRWVLNQSPIIIYRLN